MKFKSVQQAVDAIGKRIAIDGTDLTALITAVCVRRQGMTIEVSWITDGHIVTDYLDQSRIEPALGSGLSTVDWLALKVQS